MTPASIPQVLDDVLELLNELAGDWEYDGEISPGHAASSPTWAWSRSTSSCSAR